MSEVYLNGKFVGNVDNPVEFASKIREDRRRGIIPGTVNVYYKDKTGEVQVEASKGRARRPLIIVKDGQPLLTEKHIKQLSIDNHIIVENQNEFGALSESMTNADIVPFRIP